MSEKAIPILITYYTTKTPYAMKVKAIINDFNRLGVEYEVIARPSLGTRVQNQREKIYIINEVMDRLNKPILWIDADARLHKKPIFFEQVVKDGIDFSAFYRTKGWFKGWKGGIMFFNNTEKSKELLKMLKDIADYNPTHNDESILSTAIKNIKDLKTRNVPSNYFHPKKRENTVAGMRYSGNRVYGSRMAKWHPDDKRSQKEKNAKFYPDALLPPGLIEIKNDE